MNDVSGVWIPTDEEDGAGDSSESVWEVFCRNLHQRWQERQTRLEDVYREIPVSEARKRIVEAHDKG